MERVDNYIRGILTGETIEELTLSPKHMRVVASEISKIEDPDVRQQVANHFSTIFSKSDPRFDHNKFATAASGLGEGADWAPKPKSAGMKPQGYYHPKAAPSRPGNRPSPARLADIKKSGSSRPHDSYHPPVESPTTRPQNRDPIPSRVPDGTKYGKPNPWVHHEETEVDEGKVIGWMKFDPKSKTGLSFEPHRGKPVKTVTKPGGKGYTVEPDVHSKAVLARKDEGIDEAEIPMNYSFKRKERGPGMVATSSRVELDARGNKQNVTRSEIVKPERSTGKSYGLWKSQPAGSPERPAGVRPVQPTQRLTPPGGPNAQTNAPKRPSTPSWHSEAPKPYRPTESLADKARRVVDEYIEDVRAEVREALSMPSSGTTSTSTGSTTKSSSSPGKVSTTVPAASAVSTGSTKTKSI